MKYWEEYHGGTLGGAVNHGPTGCAYCNGYYYLAYLNAAGPNTLYVPKIDPKTGLMVALLSKALGAPGNQYFNVISTPTMAVFGNTIWIYCNFDSNNTHSYICKLDTTTGVIATLSDLGVSIGSGFPTNMAVTPEGDIWINANGVRRISWATQLIIATVAGTNGVGASTIYNPLDGFVWATGGTGNPTKIWRVDPATNTVNSTITKLGALFQDIIFAFNYIYAVSSTTGIHKFDPLTGAELAIFPATASSSYCGFDKKSVACIGNVGGVGTNIDIFNPVTGVKRISIIYYPLADAGTAQISAQSSRMGFVTGNQNRHTTNPWALILGSDVLSNMHMGFKKRIRKRG